MKAKDARRMDFDALLFELNREQHGRYLKAARSRDERDMIASSISLLDELTPYRTRNRRRPNRALRTLVLAFIAAVIIAGGVAVYRAFQASNPATYTLNN